MPAVMTGQSWCTCIKVTLKNKSCTATEIDQILSEELLYPENLDSDALVALAQHKELTIGHVKKLAICNIVKNNTVNDQFYRELNKHTNISSWNGVDKVILAGLAKNLTDATQLDKILTAAIAGDLDGLNNVLAALWQNKNITQPGALFNPIDIIFAKIQNKLDQLTEENLTYLAKYAKTADHFTCILTSLLSPASILFNNTNESIIRNILKNKNFDIKKITNPNHLLLLLPLCDATQCKTIIQVIRSNNLWDKFTSEALLNLANYVDSSKDIEALFKANGMTDNIINNILLKASGNRLEVLVKAVSDKELWNKLPSASLQHLVNKIDSANDLKNILKVPQCNIEVINAIITRAVHLGKKARFSKRYSLLGNIIDDVFNKLNVVTMTDLTRENLEHLNHCVTSLGPKYEDKVLLLIAEINKRGVAALKGPGATAPLSPSSTANPALQGPTTTNLSFNAPQQDIKLPEWQQQFQAKTELHQHLALANPDTHCCVFKNTEVSSFGEKEAKAFIDAIMLMANNSDKQPLTITTNNFNPAFIKTIMESLEDRVQTGQPYPKVQLRFDNFDKLSTDLQNLVTLYNNKFLPSSKSSKGSPASLDTQQQMAAQLAMLGRQLDACIPIIKVLSDGTVVLLRGINEQNKQSDELDIKAHCADMYHYLTDPQKDCSQMTITVQCAVDTKNHIEGILIIVRELAKLIEDPPGAKMQIAFKDEKGQPITEETFNKVGMEKQQWTEFEEKRQTITPPVAPPLLEVGHGPGGPA